MFDHIDLPVSDIGASVDFYSLVLAPLGYAQTSREPPEFGALSFVHRQAPKQLHVAFIAESRAVVEMFHRVGVEAGFDSNGAPGIRKYAPDYYAAYLLDPDGHNVEAVFRSAETRAGWTWLGAGLARPSGE